MSATVREGRFRNGVPYLAFGEGRPLAVFPGLGMTNGNPTGIGRWGELQILRPLARAFTVYRVGRRVGLRNGTTMADFVEDHAAALEGEFGGSVDVLGISTGGSIALQLAVDRPERVNRLVIAGSAGRLSPHGRELQRRAAELAASGDRGGLSAIMAPELADSRLGRKVAGAVLGLVGPLFTRRDWDPSDMIRTIMAEDAFDVTERLHEISAPTLVIGGERDTFYAVDLFRETVRGIPDARLMLYGNRKHGGTFTDRRFGRDVRAFLSTDEDSKRTYPESPPGE
jgi:pimeloyl-ACP methyl ester carboxylesterase